MYTIKKTANRRRGFTLVELIVVIAIILVIAALAAAFAPRVSDSQNLTRAVDSLEQWLLTAKMRAKRDQLATGLRFTVDPANPGFFSEFQYIQQPDPLSGGMTVTSSTPGAYQFPPGSGIFYTGGLCAGKLSGTGTVQFAGVDFTIGGTPFPNQWLVQPGDFLEIRDGGVYLIGAVPSPTSLTLATPYGGSLAIATPTTNYRILRQARILVGESPLTLPNNFAVDTTIIPGTAMPQIPQYPQGIIPGNTTIPWSNVQSGPSGNLEVLFSPSGAVIGANAGSGKVLLTVYNTTMNPFDINRVGIIAVQSRTGFIGAYSAAAGAGAAGYDPFFYAESGRESGL